jgi:hypothetical protein
MARPNYMSKNKLSRNENKAKAAFLAETKEVQLRHGCQLAFYSEETRDVLSP